jgi:DNA-directed RNA polymerase subunit beta
VGFNFEEPKYDVEECQQRGMTYAAPLKVTLRLVVWEVDEETGARSILDIKEQDVYMGDMPLMTDNGTFVVNGTERVIVSQMHRSPGVFFDHDKGKTHSSGKFLYAARVIPYRGSWLDFEFDAKDLAYVRIDRRRKLPVTTLLMALNSDKTDQLIAKRAKDDKTVEASEKEGYSPEEILSFFYGKVLYIRVKGGWKTSFEGEALRGFKLTSDLINAKSGKVVAVTGTKMTPRLIRELAEKGMKEQLVSNEDLIGRFISGDMFN